MALDDNRKFGYSFSLQAAVIPIFNKSFSNLEKAAYRLCVPIFFIPQTSDTMDGIETIIGKYKIVGIVVAIIAVVIYFNRYQQSESEKGKAALEKQVAEIEVEKKKLELEKQRLEYEKYKASQEQKLLSEHGGDESEAVNDLRKREQQLQQQAATMVSSAESYSGNVPMIAGKWMDSNNTGAYYVIEQNGNRITITEYSMFLGESFISASGAGYVDAAGNATVTYQTLFGTTGQGNFRIKGNVLQGIFQDQNTGMTMQITARK